MSAFAHLFVNPWLWGAIALSVLLQVAVVHFGFLNLAFGTVPLEFSQWLLCAAMATVVLWFSELRKLAYRAWAGWTSPITGRICTVCGDVRTAKELVSIR